MSSLSIALFVFSDTHVSVFTFISAITLSFLLLLLSVLHRGSDLVSHMKISLVVLSAKLKAALGHLCVVLTVQGFIPASDFYLDPVIVLSDITCVYLPLSNS